MLIKTRFAPSPTGFLHIGGLRTALYSFALAKAQTGKFVLRIEDTDKKREVKGAREKIKQTLKDFNLHWDEYYVQSERVEKDIYKKAAEKLISQGHAFYCQCRPKNAKKEGYSKKLRDPCRDKNLQSGAIKLRVPDNQVISFTDYVLGKKISWNSNEVADTTLLKSDGFPTYHLAVVVDDADMNITHVLRGHDWLPSTPVHLLVYKYLGLKIPEIGHLTDILNPSGKGKLSKRKGSVSVEGFLSEGFLKEALLNFVMLLGWAPKDNKEIFSLEEFVSRFSREGLQKSNPVFNRDKLLWLNSQYLQRMDLNELSRQIYDFYKQKYDLSLITKIVPLINTRIKTLAEFEEIARFFFKAPLVSASDFKSENYKEHLKSAYSVLEEIKDWKLENINKELMKTIEENKFKVGKFFMSLRIAITGQKITPPINESLVILGKRETLQRIAKII